MAAIFSSTGKGDIDLLLGEVLGLQECYALLQGRAGNRRVLEDWVLLLASSRAGLQSPSYLLTRDGGCDEVLAHHFGYKLRKTRNRRKMAGGDGVEESRNDDPRARSRNASAPLRRSAVGSAPVSRGTAATLFQLRPFHATHCTQD